MLQCLVGITTRTNNRQPSYWCTMWWKPWGHQQNNIQFQSRTAIYIFRSIHMQVSGIRHQSRFVLGLSLSVTGALVSQIKVTWEDLSGVKHSQTMMSNTFMVCQCEKVGKNNVDVCGAHLSKCSSIILLHPCTKLVWMSLSLPLVVHM